VKSHLGNFSRYNHYTFRFRFCPKRSQTLDSIIHPIQFILHLSNPLFVKLSIQSTVTDLICAAAAITTTAQSRPFCFHKHHLWLRFPLCSDVALRYNNIFSPFLAISVHINFLPCLCFSAKLMIKSLVLFLAHVFDNHWWKLRSSTWK
jgi:hypothetical protein